MRVLNTVCVFKHFLIFLDWSSFSWFFWIYLKQSPTAGKKNILSGLPYLKYPSAFTHLVIFLVVYLNRWEVEDVIFLNMQVALRQRKIRHIRNFMFFLFKWLNCEFQRVQTQCNNQNSQPTHSSLIIQRDENLYSVYQAANTANMKSFYLPGLHTYNQ